MQQYLQYQHDTGQNEEGSGLFDGEVVVGGNSILNSSQEGEESGDVPVSQSFTFGDILKKLDTGQISIFLLLILIFVWIGKSIYPVLRAKFTSPPPVKKKPVRRTAKKTTTKRK